MEEKDIVIEIDRDKVAAAEGITAEADEESMLLAPLLAGLSEELERIGLETELILSLDDVPYLMVMEEYFGKGNEESPISPVTIEYELADDFSEGEEPLLMRIGLSIDMNKGKIAALKKRYLAWNKDTHLSHAYFDEDKGALSFEITTTDFGRSLPAEAVKLMIDTLLDEVRKL